MPLCDSFTTPLVTLSSTATYIRHCHAATADCESPDISEVTISGVLTITNNVPWCDVTMDRVCSDSGTSWYEQFGGLGFQPTDESSDPEECDLPFPYIFRITDELGNTIDPSVNIVIPDGGTQDLYFMFGICGCCQEDGFDLSIFNDMKFVANQMRLFFSIADCGGEDGCCYVDHDFSAAICVGGDMVRYKDSGFADITEIDFDGVALAPGSTVTHDVYLYSELPCSLENVCVSITDADGDLYVGGDVIFTAASGPNVCPVQGTIAPDASHAYQLEWTIPVAPVDVDLFLEWNYCDTTGVQCCDDAIDPEPECTYNAKLAMHFIAPFVDCTACEDATQVSTPETCEGTCDGSTIVTMSPGCTLPMVSAVWDPIVDPADQTDDLAAGTSTVVNLCGGVTYHVIMEDSVGCYSEIVFTTPIVDTINIILTASEILCNGGLAGIESEVTGGTLPYTYLWTAVGGGAIVNPAQAGDPGLSNSPAGTYRLTVTDDNGCTDFQEIIVSEPVALSLSGTIVDESCPGSCDGTITLTVGGGTVPYTYAWTKIGDPGWVDPADPFIGGLCEGDYSVIVYDNNDCQITDTFTVAAPTPIAGNYVVTDKSCDTTSDGDITTPGITGGTGPYDFLWTYPDATTAATENISGLSLPGLYTIQITDSLGCIMVESYTLGTTNTYTINGVITQNNLCETDCLSEIDITVTGGVGPYTYIWTSAVPGFVDPGTEDIGSLCAGDYFVSVTDSGVPCAAIQGGPYTILAPTPIILTGLYSTFLNCHDQGTACTEFNVAGGVGPYNYEWEYWDGVAAAWFVHPQTINDKQICFDSSGFIDPNDATELKVRLIVTDANGCTATSSGVILCNPPDLALVCNPTPQSAPGLSDGSAQFVITEIGEMGCDPSLTATLSLSTGDIFPGLTNTDIVEVTNKFCQTISWTLTNTLGCQTTGTCTIDCPPDPGVEGCCDDPLALNYNCDGCEEPDPDACRYDHIACPTDWITIDGNPLSGCISAGTKLTFKAAPHFPNRVTCPPVESCCDEYGSVPEWDSTTTYATDDLVWFSDEGDLYRSLVDGNLNILPNGDPASWEQCCECGDDPIVEPCYRFAEITVTDSSGNTTVITFTDMPDTDPDFPAGGIVVDWTLCQDFLENIENYPIDYIFTTDGALSSGELTISMKLWDCFEEYECCEHKVVLCKDIRTSQVECHTWKVLDLTPAIGYSDLYPSAEWTEQNKFTLTNYMGTYQDIIWDNTGVAAQFVVPIDDVYIVKIERFYVNNIDPTIIVPLWDEPKYVIIYEFCVLLKCVKAIILDIFCSGVDCCSDDCNEADKEKEAAKRFMLNKVVALWSSLLGFIQKDKLKYLDLYYIDDERSVAVKHIYDIQKWLKDMSSNCKPCVDGAEIELENFADYPTTPATGINVPPPTPNDDDIINPNCCD